MFWIVQRRDDAIDGWVSGVQSSTTMSDVGFGTMREAIEKKQHFPRHGTTYYTIVEADERPPDTRKDYEFIDADREFTDV